MVTAAELASALGLKTGDQLRSPRPKPVDGRWKPTPVERGRIAEAGFSAVYIAAPDKLVPRYLGDEEGGWPVLTGVTSQWEDAISKQMDRHSPYHTLRVRFRFWTLNRDVAKEVHQLVDGYLRDRCDELRMSWLELPPKTDLDMMAEELDEVIQRRRILTFGDEEFVRRIRKMATDPAASG